MKLKATNADIFVPDETPIEAALGRTTHMAILAHQDDIEIAAYHGVLACFGSRTDWFTGIVVTNGAGSARSGIYADFTDEDIQNVRRIEQRKAAIVGEYGCQVQLGYGSAQVKNPELGDVADDLFELLNAARPSVVYLHNLADKHDTHIGVALRSLAALRRLEPSARPWKVYGCEVWRNLDWLIDEDKQVLPVSARPSLAAALLGVFDSQITGGKRYDLATAGRWLANATYFASHETDAETGLTYAMDLTPLVADPSLDIGEYVTNFVDRLRNDVSKRIAKFVGV